MKSTGESASENFLHIRAPGVLMITNANEKIGKEKGRENALAEAVKKAKK
jgi:hypothetical protein